MKVPMKVPSNPNVPLSSLSPGQTFWTAGGTTPCLKTDDAIKNVIRLDTGTLLSMSGNDMVTPQAGEFLPD